MNIFFILEQKLISFKYMENNLESIFKAKRTESRIKWLLLFTITILPFTIISTLFNAEAGAVATISIGAVWGIGMAIFALNILVVILLNRFTEQVKWDMMAPTVGWVWFIMAWYGLPMIGWWRILVSILFFGFFYMAAAASVVLISFAIYLRKINNFTNGINSNLNGDQATEKMSFKDLFGGAQGDPNSFFDPSQLKDLDEALRQEGIDIDKLDEQFGNFMHDDKQGTETIKINDDEEVSEPIATNKDKKPQSEVIEEEGQTIIENYVNEEEDSDEQKTIIDQ